MNELIQLILTYILLAMAAGYAVYSGIRVLFPKKAELQPGCGKSCGCDSVNLKKDLLLAKKIKG